MIENALDLHHIVDQAGRIIYVSPAIEAVLGYTAEELLGVMSSELVHPDDLAEPAEMLAHAEQHIGRFHFLEQRIRHKDGSWRLMEVAGRFSTDPQGRPIVLVYSRDLTERRRAEAERDALLERERRLRGRAERAAQARENMLAVVSHDLRNPLATILLNSTAILDRLGHQLGGWERDLLEGIVRSSDQMDRLIEGLLDLASIDAGRLTLAPQVHEMRPLLLDVEALMRPLALHRSVHLAVPAAESPVALHVDRARVLQLFSNVVGNAIKFSPDGGVVSLGFQVEDGTVRFVVRDSGPGIPAEHLPHVFTPFWQGRPRRRDGIGLGLAISKGIVEAHGGSIWVQSQPGDGSTVSFTLPSAS